jgi:hypothetical protein
LTAFPASVSSAFSASLLAPDWQKQQFDLTKIHNALQRNKLSHQIKDFLLSIYVAN